MESLRTVFKVLTRVGILAAGTLACLFIALAIEHSRSFSLPEPTGSYPVGRTISVWEDTAPDLLAPTLGAKRKLMVWIWYPAGANDTLRPDCPYLPRDMSDAVTVSRGLLLGKFLSRDLSSVEAHSIPNASAARSGGPFPVILLRGGASAGIWNYTALAEDLASHGYVVVGFDAPYRTGVVALPDGQVVRRLQSNDPEEGSGVERMRRVERILGAWTADMRFVLDQLGRLNAANSGWLLSGQLDLERVGAVGHSFGGAQAAEFCRLDPRCKVGVDLDGLLLSDVIRSGLHQPFLFLLSEHRGENDTESRQIMADLRSVYGRMPEGVGAFLKIRGGNHFFFSDDGALLKSHIILSLLRFAGVVGIDGQRQLAITQYCVRKFLDGHLRQGKAPEAGVLLSPQYPEPKVIR